jgi:hypothetical protein
MVAILPPTDMTPTTTHGPARQAYPVAKVFARDAINRFFEEKEAQFHNREPIAMLFLRP